jgi:hypothetical protein
MVLGALDRLNEKWQVLKGEFPVSGKFGHMPDY